MRKKIALILVLLLVLSAMLLGGRKHEETEESADLSVAGVVQLQEAASEKAVKAGVAVSLGTVTQYSENGGICIATERDGAAVRYVVDDVDEDAWYAQAVNYVICGDLFVDIVPSDETVSFAPERGVTRAQFAAVVYRFVAAEPVEEKCSFADVEPDAWYYDAVNWSVQMGYLSGMDAENFEPDAFVSCEQVLSVLHRMAGAVKSETTLEEYPYAPKVSDYAKNAVAWAWGVGLIAQEEALWYPTQTISRAQLALLLMRYDALTGGLQAAQ